VNDQPASAWFNERAFAQESDEGFFVPREQRQQLLVLDVTGGEQQEFGRALAGFVSDMFTPPCW